MSEPLICVEQLLDMKSDENLIILDASMLHPLPGQNNDVEQGAIPGAIRFDIEEVFSDKQAPFPHSRLTASQFQSAIRKLGVNKASKLVVYDNMGIYSSPRAWWLLKSMGASEVFVLDGGLDAWLKAGHSLVTHSEAQSSGNFESEAEGNLFIDSPEILRNLDKPNIQIIDARSHSRFLGLEAEPRVGVRSGHIPGSVNIHFRELTENGSMKTKHQLEALFSQRKISHDATLIFTCGSGITACILALAAEQIGYKKLRVFDGSWAEWGASPSLPVECAGS